MKPPRLPKSPPWMGDIPAEPLSLIGLAEHSSWACPIVAGKPVLVSWRTMLSLLLGKVPIEPVAECLWPTLQAMSEQVWERLGDAAAAKIEDTTETTYSDWLSMWCEQFQHWHDPVRMLVAKHCSGGDAAIVAQHFQRFNGLAFADFVVEAINAHDERRMWQARIMEQDLPAPFLPLSIPRSANATAMDWACQQLYLDFKRRTTLATCPVITNYGLQAFVDVIYADCGHVRKST